jgi:hypothetical protein
VASFEHSRVAIVARCGGWTGDKEWERMRDPRSIDQELTAQRWHPSLADFETIATMGNAGAPLERIAAAVGCSEGFLRAWFGWPEAAREAPIDDCIAVHTPQRAVPSAGIGTCDSGAACGS